MEFTAMMSYAIPGTAVGIGYILAFNKPPLLFTGTAFILIACYVFRNVPIGIQSGTAALKQISKEIEESSTNLGANSAYTFKKITLPLKVAGNPPESNVYLIKESKPYAIFKLGKNKYKLDLNTKCAFNQETTSKAILINPEDF